MFVKISEQPSLYNDLEKKSVREILEDINREDQKVALAVQKAIPQIEKLVTQIVPRMKQGGRIFYMGAGTSGRLGVLDASEIPPTFGMPPTLIIGLIAGGDTALRNPVENAEDDMQRGWEELVERNITDKDTVIGIVQLAFYLMGYLGYKMEQRNLRNKLLFIPYYFLFMNINVIRGYSYLAKHKGTGAWEKAKRGAG